MGMISNLKEIAKKLKEEIETEMKSEHKIKVTATVKPDVSLEQKVREIAYLKWEAAGMPTSDGSEFWLAAEEEVFGLKEGLLDLEKSQA